MKHVPELIAAYAAMSPWARSLLLDVAKDYAIKFPAPKKQVSLTLVQADGICVKAPPDLLDNGVDRQPSVVVREPVDREKA